MVEALPRLPGSNHSSVYIEYVFTNWSPGPEHTEQTASVMTWASPAPSVPLFAEGLTKPFGRNAPS
jgi:hypothetical protein